MLQANKLLNMFNFLRIRPARIIAKMTGIGDYIDIAVLSFSSKTIAADFFERLRNANHIC